MDGGKGGRGGEKSDSEMVDLDAGVEGVSLRIALRHVDIRDEEQLCNVLNFFVHSLTFCSSQSTKKFNNNIHRMLHTIYKYHRFLIDSLR
jgi:hypothetical protein